MAPKHYDYIIAGAGCAGLSLLMRMMEDTFFSDKQILVIDQVKKNSNDRTWCFWEKEPGLFESIVHHQWHYVNFYSNDFFAKLDLHPYQYKMIHGIEFYETVIKKAETYSNITFRYEPVDAIISTANNAIVKLKTESLTAAYVFNSILFEKDQKIASNKTYHLLQHFKGWVIETAQATFDPQVATLMDFRISQEHGTTFFYVMPTSTTSALIEYTLFTEQLLPDSTYDEALKNYIAQYLLVSQYEIKHSEFGVIPMTNQCFPLQDGQIVQMGVAGGQVKGSSGYAFQFIQKRTASIIDGLKKGKTDFSATSFHQKKGNLYDAVLLNVFHHHKMQGDQIFEAIFSKTKAATVLRFLDNESSLIEDLQIMNTVPIGIFLPAALQELMH